MAIERPVRRTAKDKDGDITSLCNTGESWSPRMRAGAISDVEGGNIKYYVEEQSPGPTSRSLTTGTPAHHGRQEFQEQSRQPARLLRSRMAQSTCVMCGGNTFEMREASPAVRGVPTSSGTLCSAPIVAGS